MQKRRELLILSALALSSTLCAENVTLDALHVEATVLSDVAKEEIKSGDLSQTLSNTLANISLVRRSGIANDIILRGQKKDNINVIVDNGKIYGACPNRMDPTTSHVLTNNIDSVEVIEGPYDVENFGTLSGAVKITTKQPKEGLSGEVNFNYGSFNYSKAAINIEGGNEKVKLLVSSSIESSDQYKDGNGDTLAQQLINTTQGTPLAGVQYKDVNQSAYEKKTLLTKVFINVSDTQEFIASYTANRSDNVLYPSSKMDALYDNSDIYNVEYSIKNSATFSKKLSLQYYNSFVDHPMSTKFRKMSNVKGVITSALTSQIQGAKVINTSDVTSDFELKLGLDSSVRNWDGSYYKNEVDTTKNSISDVDTVNMALFTQFHQKFSDYIFEGGLRLDYTTITPSSTQQKQSYESLSANLLTRYYYNDRLNFFAGLGKASRVPDARELYFMGINGNVVGSDTLKQTSNYETDLGVHYQSGALLLKSKLFFSYLQDYIYYNSSNVNAEKLSVNAFENIDATIYGFDISGSYYFNDALSSDFAVAYQRGQKTQALANQTNTNLAEIPPLKGSVAVNFEYQDNSMATLQLLASDEWSAFDSDNGEQAIDAWAVLNAKVRHSFNETFEGTLGVENLFNKTYRVSNTYNDLTLVGAADNRMLLNEPGRYVYANLKIIF